MSSAISTTLGALSAVTGKRAVSDGFVTVVVGGTFSGTVTIRATPNGGELTSGSTAPADVPIGVGMTTPGSQTVQLAGDWLVDAIMSAYASGAANVAVAVGGIRSR